MACLKNKIVWLTGASSGIGEALARELVKRGAKVAISARREALLSSLCQESDSRNGIISAFPVDVTDLSSLKQTCSEIETSLGPIDILIANAGTHVFTVPEDFNSNEYMSLMNLNFGGTLNTIEAVLPRMIERKAGHVVGVASLAGFRGLPRAAAYGASKAALIHFLESLRFHMRRKGIKVTIVNPGFVKTPLTDRNDFHMPFLISADKAAITICNGIESDRDEISFPFLFASALKLMRILPFRIYDFIVDQFVWPKAQ
ncbi:MAG: SDR family NAD(P)-dependent oxidoreductase [Bdellovibrionales bacterium]|nr:SDR family NAD(P)-dependent oxidoreductase [Bdellovibrionales bacterium]